jgi:hypothetical protein
VVDGNRVLEVAFSLRLSHKHIEAFEKAYDEGARLELDI